MHQRESSCMGKRVVYVGGLSDSVSDCNLRDLFCTFGLVARAHVVRHKHSGKSAGYGFVEMASGEQALEAVVALGRDAVRWQLLTALCHSLSIKLPLRNRLLKCVAHLPKRRYLKSHCRFHPEVRAQHSFHFYSEIGHEMLPAKIQLMRALKRQTESGASIVWVT